MLNFLLIFTLNHERQLLIKPLKQGLVKDSVVNMIIIFMI